ncbi:MAG: NADH-quinone oxidoreductase subunit [Actinomycetota bacterium]|nr:NADH-quinone oxidoreductase subunit [Actinomycetota bacterium]
MSFLTDDNRARARDIVAQYPNPRSAIMPLAYLAQDQHGWVPNEAIGEIAELLGLAAAEVQGTVSFYTMFKRRPCGRLVVSVCTNVTCLVLGGPQVLEWLESSYALDDDVTVEEVECLAACDGAPAMQVNYEFHEGVTPETAAAIVEDYKAGRVSARTISGTPV